MAVVVGRVPTKEGRAALRRAAHECRLRGDRLVVVNSALDPRSYDDKDIERFEALLDEVRASLAGTGVEYVERDRPQGNEPGEDLIAVADEVDADMIVIGLRRRTPVGKLLLGSNAQRILLEASCAVLAVKAEND